MLIETHVVDEPLPQRVGLFVQARENGELMIGLHEIGFPRPTSGVHLAVAHLAGWILTLHPEMKLLNHNLRYEIPTNG